MKKFTLIIITLFAAHFAKAQETPDSLKRTNSETTHQEIEIITEESTTIPQDTIRIKVAGKEILIVKGGKSVVIEETETTSEGKTESASTTDSSDNDEITSKKKKTAARWSGLDFGVNVLTDGNGSSAFSENPIYNIDPAKSLYFNLNLFDHKFDIYKGYVGFTTGIGLNFNHFGFKNNYILSNQENELVAIKDTVHSYSKNKLNATYIQVPLLLQINTSTNKRKSLALSAGVIAGIRIGSKVKQEFTTEINGIYQESKYKNKDDYALNPFKLDATVRIGYKSLGVFANYSLIPLFDLNKTVAVHPASFGVSFNF